MHPSEHISPPERTVVVIGNGVIGHRFCQRLHELGATQTSRVVVFGEEPRAAYDRMGLTQFLVQRDSQKLVQASRDWYQSANIDLRMGERACRIDRTLRVVTSESGDCVRYDKVVVATGTYPYAPQVPGIKHRGVFVYRTPDDLQFILPYAQQSRRVAIVGGGFLGLEAASALSNLELEIHVVDCGNQLLPRQIDESASTFLVEHAQALGIQVYLEQRLLEVVGDSAVTGLLFDGGRRLDIDMLIISAGSRPRDELALECGLTMGIGGGIQVNDALETSDCNIYAIGAVALHAGTTYDLSEAGYQMADVAVRNILGSSATFHPGDNAAQTRPLDISIASLGSISRPDSLVEIYKNASRHIYRRLVFCSETMRLLGASLVGDTSGFDVLRTLLQSQSPLAAETRSRLVQPVQSHDLPSTGQDAATVGCSCQILREVERGQADSPAGNGAVPNPSGPHFPSNPGAKLRS